MSKNFLELERINHLESVADYIINSALKAKAQASVSISVSEGHEIAVANRKLEALEFKGGLSLDINWYYDNRSLSYSSSDITSYSISQALDSIQSKVKFLEPDPFSGLPDKSFLAYDYQDLDLYHDWDCSIEQQIEMAKECEIIALELDQRIKQCESSNLNASKIFNLHANTLGLKAQYLGSYYSMSCCLLTEDQGGQMHRDYDYTVARNPAKLDSITKLANSAAKNTLGRLGAKSIKSQKAKVLFSPKMSRSLVTCLLSAISGRNIYRNSSFLRDSLNKSIFPDFVNIIDDPTIKQGMASSYFDSEGVKTHKRHIIKDGILQGYLLSSYSARKLGMTPTGNAGGSHNICVLPSVENKDILGLLGTGILITDMMGQGLNILTGDFSKGAFGFWVENGEIVCPVQEFTIAGNLIDMYKNIIAIGDDLDTQSSIQTGSWLLESMTIAGSL